MTARYSIYYELQTSRWGKSHIPNKPPAQWKLMLKWMRQDWEYGTDTILETFFYERFDGRAGNPHLPDSMFS